MRSEAYNPADQPELDSYSGKGTPGNRALIMIVKKLSCWLKDFFPFTTYRRLVGSS